MKKEDLKRICDVLEFYANKGNYGGLFQDEVLRNPPIEHDQGEKARELLNELGKMDN